MRPRALLACLAIPLLLAGCGEDQSPPTAPMAPDLSAAARRTPLEPGHTYRFDFTCSAAAVASNSLVWIVTATNIPRLGVTCNSSTELGMAYGTSFDRFDYEIAFDPSGVAACSKAGITTTGSYRCKARKLTATLTVTDEGVILP